MAGCCRPLITGISGSPTYMQSNQHIIHGYRVNFSKMQCIKSVFSFSNETINIWSHLFGVLWFISSLIDINTKILPALRLSSGSDHFVMTVFCVCLLLCFLFSASYHTFSCHSQFYNDLWYKLDLLGISVGVWGCYMAGLYYGFYCDRFWTGFYMSVLGMVLALNLICQVLGRRINAFADVSPVSIYIGIVIFGFLPKFHWIYVNGGFGSSIVQYFMPRVMGLYTIAGVAVVFYLVKFPERWFPGRFDYLGSSHQIWHFLILIALITHYNSTFQLMALRLSGTEKCHI